MVINNLPLPKVRPSQSSSAKNGPESVENPGDDDVYDEIVIIRQ